MYMICNKRFERLAKKYGFRIKKVSNPWYSPKGKLLFQARRADILSVQYKNRHIMTIPRKMYAFSKSGYRPLGSRSPHPDYFTCEHQLKNWNLIIKRTPQSL